MQTQLGNDGTNPLQSVVNGAAVQPSNTFQLGEFLVGNGQTEENATGSVNRVLSVQAGLDGTILNGRFNWNLFYTHGENRLAVDLINNQNLQHMYAAEDAVLTPSGNVACYAATSKRRRPDMPDCVPFNPFRTHRAEPERSQLYFPDHGFPPDQHPGRHGRQPSRARCWRLGRAHHRRVFGGDAIQRL